MSRGRDGLGPKCPVTKQISVVVYTTWPILILILFLHLFIYFNEYLGYFPSDLTILILRLTSHVLYQNFVGNKY